MISKTQTIWRIFEKCPSVRQSVSPSVRHSPSVSQSVHQKLYYRLCFVKHITSTIFLGSEVSNESIAMGKNDEGKGEMFTLMRELLIPTSLQVEKKMI